MLRRRPLLFALAALLPAALAGCATGLRAEPIRVNVVGIEPLEGQGLELRLGVRMRVQNPNSAALDFEGISIRLDLRGSEFATGVSPQKGTVPGFGELVVTVPVTVSALAIVRQAIGLAGDGDRSKISLRLRGRLARAGFDGFGLATGVGFESSGEIELPAALSGVSG